jgi:hypothetical protein
LLKERIGNGIALVTCSRRKHTRKTLDAVTKDIAAPGGASASPPVA